jgi:DegV family protein with EDD domain
MHSYAIITDDAVQGISSNSRHVIDFYTIGYDYPFFTGLDTASFQENNSSFALKSLVSICLPTTDTVRNLVIKANSQYDEIFCILSAGNLTYLSTMIDEIAEKNKSKADFHLIDSQTLSAGQGYLVNKAIQMIEKNISPKKIDATLREIIPNIYTILGSTNLSYLHASGFLDAGQMIVGEQHAIIPLFSLENGKLNSLEKFKNLHGIADYLLEFLEEFEKIEQVIFIHPMTSKLHLFQEIKQFTHENHEVNSYSEYSSNEFLSNLIGPEGFGMILIE